MEYPQLIRRAPRAFAGLARKHNQLARQLSPVLNLTAGKGIVITQAQNNTHIAQNDADASPFTAVNSILMRRPDGVICTLTLSNANAVVITQQ